MLVHLDTDFLIYALARSGPERRRLVELAESENAIGISAIAWYEFSRGPRTPEQLATARALFADDGIVSFSEPIAALAAEIFRQLGSPRRRAADIAIGVTATSLSATLLTRNARDFAGIPGLEVESSLSVSNS
jgi:predicted nucleic acid-binding protein